MTKPAKSQEPSMEEILASIRRIIADDDAGRVVKQASDAPGAPEASDVHGAFEQPAVPPRPSFFAAPEPSIPRTHTELMGDPGAASEAEEDHASEILDLTESMTARMVSEPEPAPALSAVPDAISEFHEPEPVPQFYAREPEPQFYEPGSAPAPQFHVTESYSDVHVEEAVEQPVGLPPAEPSVRYVTPETERHGAGDRGAGERGAGGRGPLLSSATSAAVDSAFNALAHTVLVQNARTLEDLVREMLRPMLKTWLDDNLPGLVERLVRAEIERVARGR